MRRKTLQYPFKISARMRVRTMPQQLDVLEAAVIEAKEQGDEAVSAALNNLMEHALKSSNLACQIRAHNFRFEHIPENYQIAGAKDTMNALDLLSRSKAIEPMINFMENVAGNLKKFDPQSAIDLAHSIIWKSFKVQSDLRTSNPTNRNELAIKVNAALEDCVAYEDFNSTHYQKNPSIEAAIDFAISPQNPHL